MTSVSGVPEVELLSAQLAAEKPRGDNLQAQLNEIHDIFGKKLTPTNSRHGGGAVRQFTTKAKSIVIACASMGESSVSINREMKTMTAVCPQLLGPDSDVPSTTTIDEWRNLIPGMNFIQTSSWIDRAERIVLAVVASDVSNTS